MSSPGLVVVGDIHGCAEKLASLLDSDCFSERVAVFLGDYVDLGRSSKETIDLLINFSKRTPSIYLCGNHDLAMLNYLKTGDFASYAKIGGIATIVSYCKVLQGDVLSQFRTSVPDSHLEFLQNLKTYHETTSFVLSHCGVSVDAPSDRSLDAMVVQSHQELFTRSHGLSKTVVCGHYYQRGLVPFFRERFVCIDTGCGALVGGRLTALLLPELEYVQF